MAISDETLAIAIPASLKTDHPDASLVVQGILIALTACENSSAMTAKSRMRDVHKAIEDIYVPIFQAHIAKEDEDWSALKARADKYVPIIKIGAPIIKKRGHKEFPITADGNVIGHGKLFSDDEGFAVSIPNLSHSQRTAEGNAPTMGGALYEAVTNAGFDQAYALEYDGAWGVVESDRGLNA